MQELDVYLNIVLRIYVYFFVYDFGKVSFDKLKISVKTAIKIDPWLALSQETQRCVWTNVSATIFSKFWPDIVCILQWNFVRWLNTKIFPQIRRMSRNNVIFTINKW